VYRRARRTLPSDPINKEAVMANVGSKIREGMEVRTAEGEKLGKVAHIEGEQFTIEKGWLFKTDYVAYVDGILEIRGEEIIYQPVSDEDRAKFGQAEGETRLPLVEEELEVDKHIEQKGEVRVTKEVVTEQKQVTVPVTREEVKVERVPVDRREASELPIEKGQVTVPVMEEEVTVSKRPVVREEVRVSKEAVQEQRTASGEVRREEAHVEQVDEQRRAGKGDKPIEEEEGMRTPGRDRPK
jgi:uncharacterized protein (TIGR02271 family)